MNAILSFWTRALDFKGTSSRRDFVIGYLGNLGILFVVSLVLGFIGGFSGNDLVAGILGFLTSLLSIAVSVAGISLEIRRLRDIGKPWFFIFLSCIPCVNFYLLYLLFFVKGIGGDNSFIPNATMNNFNQNQMYGQQPTMNGYGQNQGFEQQNYGFNQQNNYNQQMNGFNQQNNYNQQNQMNYGQQNYNQQGYNQGQNNNPYGY